LSTVCGSEKIFENWLIFGEDMENDKVGRFLGSSSSSSTTVGSMPVGV